MEKADSQKLMRGEAIHSPKKFVSIANLAPGSWLPPSGGDENDMGVLLELLARPVPVSGYDESVNTDAQITPW